MKLHCRGANLEVTGSRHLLEVNGKKILLDCGLYQGRRKDEFDKNENLQFEANEIDSVILSHAHIDHSGNLPNLVKQGFTGPIHCTKPTADLIQHMLRDSGYIQEREVEYLNKKKKRAGEPLIEPLYTLADVEETLPLAKPVSYDEWVNVCDGVQVVFREAGHILGSAVVELKVQDQEDTDEQGNPREKTLIFTGDLGRKDMPLLKDPYQPKHADYLLTESTYGGRLHDDINAAEGELAEIVTRVAARGGKILIPAFSLGRTQEMIYALHKMFDEGKIPEIPIYVDSPLSVNVTSVFRENLNVFDEETQQLFISENEDPFGFERLKYTKSVEESKALNNHHGPCIIISASGMIEHGRILHHLKNSIEDHRNCVLIVGYQAAHTLGRKLIEGEKRVNIFGKPHDVQIEIKVMNNYSAHADRKDLLDFAAGIEGLKKVVIVHGEPESSEALKQGMIEERGITSEIIIPQFGKTLEL
jgi:metallo-beta-lactamase family protein